MTGPDVTKHIEGSELGNEPPEPGTGNRLLAILLVFLGLSVANAFGGILQLAYLVGCLFVALRTPHLPPKREIALATGSGIIAAVATIQYDPSLAPAIGLVRPVLEGYLLAVVLYACRIRTPSSLMFTLGGYVLLQVVAAGVMLASPGLRLGLLQSWYAGEGYQNEAFLTALIFRGFGVSRHHLFGLPLAVGTISAMLVIMSRLRASNRGAALSLFTAVGGVVVVLLNARIGLVPIFLCYVLGLILFHRSFYARQVLIVVPLAMTVLLVLARSYLGDSLDLVSQWLIAGFRQFWDQDASADSTTVSDLARMLILPDSWSAWLFGEGRICQPGDACYSDIGWIRLLQGGGLVLTAAVSILYAGAIKSMFGGRLWVGADGAPGADAGSRRQLTWIFALTFIAATVKGESFGSNDYSRLVIMLSSLAGMVDPLAHPVSKERSRTTEAAGA